MMESPAPRAEPRRWRRLCLFFPAVVSCWLLAAHYLRGGETGLVWLWVSAPLLLLLRRRWVAVVLFGLLLAGAGVWSGVAAFNVHLRLIHGEPWRRMAMILGGVALFTAISALGFRSRTAGLLYQTGADSWRRSAATFALAGTLLGIVQFKVKPPSLLLERFLAGGGWFTVFWLSAYAAWLGEKIGEPRLSLRACMKRVA